MTDVVIIGAGPAGMTAAIYAVRAGLSVKLLEAEMYGGQMTSTPEIDNYPAVGKLEGWQLAQNMYEHITQMGINIDFEKAEKIIKNGDDITVMTSSGEYRTKAVIICTGAKRRKLGVEGEERLSGRGVSYCAICDGAFFKEKTACVVGGGNTALEDAAYLANICKKVYLVHRRDEFRAEKHLVESALAKDNIEILYSYQASEILGDEKVTSIKLKSVADSSEKEIETDAVFVAIGLEPQNTEFADVVGTDRAGYVIADESCITDTKGIYVAGDARTKKLRQIITAASDGASAAKQAFEYIQTLSTQA